ncbi:activating transcription factor 7-interacting protein 2 isoform X2 [Erythrolamprus reginae]|uniref:activating transcription factor 7-interacting protein 2 isoform X2 n=1 Tax=Erythrolamprus reginae TaxID=121349 RepID=UPI00396CAECC
MNSGVEVAVRKPLRARKTMAPSSRKQLSQVKRAELRDGIQSPAGEEPRPPKEPLASLPVNSETSTCPEPQKAAQPSPDLQRFLNGGTLQDLLSYWYEKDSEAPRSEPLPPPRHSDQPPVASARHKSSATDTVAETPAGQTRPALLQPESHSGVPERDGEPAVPLGEVRRKRAASGNREEDHILPKRSKAYGAPTEGATPAPGKTESGLDKVKGLIRSQLEASVRELDQGLQHLNERIDRIQYPRKHEGIAMKIFKKISRLNRHINAVILFQRKWLSHKAKPRLNGDTLPPDTNVASQKPTSTERLSERSPGAGEGPCVEASKPSPEGVLPATEAPAPPPKAAAGWPDPAGDQDDALVIDLTDGEGHAHKEKTKVVGSRPLGPESRPERLPRPARESPDQVAARFPHLPPLPSGAEADAAPRKDLGDSPPPQRLELVVAQVKQPKGFALQWNVSRVDPRCAPIESFSLFICLEDLSNGTTSEWRRTSVIKALPLPMACSLSQFPRSVKCYFTMRSKDVHGRHGPFCEVQSISAL